MGNSKIEKQAKSWYSTTTICCASTSGADASQASDSFEKYAPFKFTHIAANRPTRSPIIHSSTGSPNYGLVTAVNLLPKPKPTLSSILEVPVTTPRFKDSKFKVTAAAATAISPSIKPYGQRFTTPFSQIDASTTIQTPSVAEPPIATTWASAKVTSPIPTPTRSPTQIFFTSQQTTPRPTTPRPTTPRHTTPRPTTPQPTTPRSTTPRSTTPQSITSTPTTRTTNRLKSTQSIWKTSHGVQKLHPIRATAVTATASNSVSSKPFKRETPKRRKFELPKMKLGHNDGMVGYQRIVMGDMDIAYHIPRNIQTTTTPRSAGPTKRAIPPVTAVPAKRIPKAIPSAKSTYSPIPSEKKKRKNPEFIFSTSLPLQEIKEKVKPDRMHLPKLVSTTSRPRSSSTFPNLKNSNLFSTSGYDYGHVSLPDTTYPQFPPPTQPVADVGPKMSSSVDHFYKVLTTPTSPSHFERKNHAKTQNYLLSGFARDQTFFERDLKKLKSGIIPGRGRDNDMNQEPTEIMSHVTISSTTLSPPAKENMVTPSRFFQPFDSAHTKTTLEEVIEHEITKIPPKQTKQPEKSNRYQGTRFKKGYVVPREHISFLPIKYYANNPLYYPYNTLTPSRRKDRSNPRGKNVYSIVESVFSDTRDKQTFQLAAEDDYVFGTKNGVMLPAKILIPLQDDLVLDGQDEPELDARLIGGRL